MYRADIQWRYKMNAAGQTACRKGKKCAKLGITAFLYSLIGHISARSRVPGRSRASILLRVWMVVSQLVGVGLIVYDFFACHNPTAIQSTGHCGEDSDTSLTAASGTSRNKVQPPALTRRTPAGGAHLVSQHCSLSLLCFPELLVSPFRAITYS